MRDRVIAAGRPSKLGGGDSRRAAALWVLVGVLSAGCALPAPHAQHPGAPPTGSLSPTVVGSPAPAAPSAATDPAVAHPAGASAQVSRIVIMQQLARRAERIAKHTPLPPRPSDVDPGSNRALGYQMMLEFGFPADQWPYLDALWRRESGWNHLAEPLLRRLRHPAVPARREDGRGRTRLAHQPADADRVGPGLHRRPLLLAAAGVGALGEARLVLSRRRRRGSLSPGAAQRAGSRRGRERAGRRC